MGICSLGGCLAQLETLQMHRRALKMHFAMRAAQAGAMAAPGMG
jgi:hypothetical protein